MKRLRVTVDGKAYDVLVELLDDEPVRSAPTVLPPVSSAAVAAPAAAAAPRVASAGDVVSPLAGRVVSVDVKTGQNVPEGAQLATVEAMKMNTYIFAPKAGRVDAVLVTPGAGVEEGTVLLRIV